MIISASYRTDIPAFYSKWFLERYNEGGCITKNPYNNKSSFVSLRKNDVDAFVFWTRNAAPFQDILAKLHTDGIPFLVQYTLTGYPQTLERAVPQADHSVETMKRIAKLYGSSTVVWRYDPILLSNLTPKSFHIRQFKKFAKELRGATDEVITSFLTPYKKTLRRLLHVPNLVLKDSIYADKQNLLNRLLDIACQNSMALKLCAQPTYITPHIPAARCIDIERISRIANRTVIGRENGNRPGCKCSTNRDIGSYDTCPQGCAYCYATSSNHAAVSNLIKHSSKGLVLKN